jgi:hypothetical protein
VFSPRAARRSTPPGFLVTVAAVVAATAAGLSTAGAQTEPDSAEGAAAAQGVTQTLAGPGYCPTASNVVEGSEQVRALAADEQGRVFYETGPPDDRGVIATVHQVGVATVRSGIPQPPVPSGAPPASKQTVPGAGRLVATGEGGVVVTAGTRLVALDGETRRTVAGDPASELGGIGRQRAGDSGPAEQAQFRHATSVAQDQAGNLYVADHGGPALATATIRFINRSDQPVTFYPDTPEEVTVEPGHIDTIAGISDPEASDQTDRAEEEGSPQAAAFFGNTTLAVDSDRLYVASALDQNSPEATVELINLGGEELTAHGQTVQPGSIETVAGGGNEPSQQLAAAAGIALTGQDLYVTDPARHRVHHVDAEGFMETFAGAEGLGATVGGFNGNRRPAVGARLDHPVDVAVGPDGGVHIADRDNGQVRVVGDDKIIRAVRGSGVGLSRSCAEAEGKAASRIHPRPGAPASVVSDGQGNVYFTLADAHLIKRRAPSGKTTTVAGQGECELGCAGFADDGGPAEQATLDTPTALAMGPKGGLYVYDGGNARVRYVNLTDQPVAVHGVTVPAGAIDTVAGSGTPGSGGDEGPALEVDLGEVANPGLYDAGQHAAGGFNYSDLPRNLGALTVDAQGNLFIAETPQHPDGGAYIGQQGKDEALDAQVRRVNPEGKLTTVAGADATGPARECCHDPSALALDSDGNLYITDASTYQVWLLNRSDQQLTAHGQTIDPSDIEVVAGTGDPGFTPQAADATETDLLAPAGLALTDDGTLHVAELGIIPDRDPGHYIHSIHLDGGLSLLAGSGQPGFNGDALDPRLASLNLPTDLAVDDCGNLLVADAGNDRLRRINLAGPCNPAAQQAANTANTNSSATVTIGLLAAAAVAVGLAGGWYWRRRTHPGPARR